MNPQLSFFDTTNLPLLELVKATKKADTQTTIVLSLFQKYGELTASECWRLYCKEFCPEPLLWSVRRSCSVLKNRGNLEFKANKEKRMGMHGSPECIYKFVRK